VLVEDIVVTLLDVFSFPEISEVAKVIAVSTAATDGYFVVLPVSAAMF